jgi:predicted nucleic-acid-binding Zn-ribbon protein
VREGIIVTLAFSARCPKCDNRSFEPPELLDVALEFSCKACGYRGKLVEFADLATLDAIVDDLKKRALETVRNASGAKAMG